MPFSYPAPCRFNLEASAERQALIAEAMGLNTAGMTPHTAGLAAADAVAQLSQQRVCLAPARCGCPAGGPGSYCRGNPA